MIEALHIAGYRSLKDLSFALGPLTLITGENGTGKSNVFRALALLKAAAQGRLAEALASEGGMPAVLFAGPEQVNRDQAAAGTIQGGPRQKRVALVMAVAFESLRYEINIGLPPQANHGEDLFTHEPDIKSELIWAGKRRPSSTLIERKAQVIIESNQPARAERHALESNESMLWQLSDSARFPELAAMRALVAGWRLHHGFATEANGPARQLRIGFRAAVLADDGANLASVLATIREIGDGEAFDHAITQAFPGARVHIDRDDDGRFLLRWQQFGLLRPLGVHELSDGTLRYLCLLAALHTPRPGSLLAFNEPELSLYPELLQPLARQFRRASRTMQIIVVSHAPGIIHALEDDEQTTQIVLEREYGATRVRGQTILSRPSF